ncbi:MAG TPA: cytochrome c [Beijerinckiaceae bacterium]|jgi:cytochrome c556
MMRNLALWALGVGLLASSSSLSPAHEGATGIVKQRMDEMEHVGRVVKRINERLKSKRGLAEIARDAEEIRAAAARAPSLFPPGSRDGHTEATAAVWERWPEFVAAARALEREAEKLGSTAGAGQEAAIAAQFRSVTRACSGCHDVFRVKR